MKVRADLALVRQLSSTAVQGTKHWDADGRVLSPSHSPFPSWAPRLFQLNILGSLRMELQYQRFDLKESYRKIAKKYLPCASHVPFSLFASLILT